MTDDEAPAGIIEEAPPDEAGGDADAVEQVMDVLAGRLDTGSLLLARANFLQVWADPETRRASLVLMDDRSAIVTVFEMTPAFRRGLAAELAGLNAEWDDAEAGGSGSVH